MFGDNLSSRVRRILEIVRTCGDWILFIALEVVCQVVGDRKPFAQLFSVLNPAISYPLAATEKVPGSILYLYCFGIPAVSVLIVSMAFGPGDLKRRAKLLNWGLLGVAASGVVAQLFTEVIKIIVGKPRPDLLSRCQPDAARVRAALIDTAVVLFDSSICTTTDIGKLQDGFRAFPSGHSSMSFAGLTYLALYFSGRLRLFAPHSPHGKHVYSYFLIAAPLLFASFIAASRVSDFRHSGVDVFGGAALGIFFGLVGYRYYFPWPHSQLAGIPWMLVHQEQQHSVKVATEGGERDENSHTQLPLLPTTHGSRNLAQGSQNSHTPHDDAGRPMELQNVPPVENAYSTQPHAI